MGRLYLDIECYCRTAAACVDIDVQYTISTSSRSPSIRYDLAHNFTKICTLLEYTWYLVSLVEAEPDTKWVDRGLIRLHLDTECYRRTAAVCVDTRYTISTSSPSIPYDLAHLYLPKYVPYLNVPGTWYLVEAEPDTKWVDRA